MARGKRTEEDNSILSMALIGYEAEKQKIENKIREIRGILGGKSSNGSYSKPVLAAAVEEEEEEVPASSTKKRTLSTAARKRIAAAQKKRWAEHRKRVAASKQG